MAMVMEEPRWLIQDIWTAGSHGVIAGEPKTNKTTIAMAMALSVASGSPFLGQHPCGVSGPVLFVQEENAPWMMQDRLRKLAWLAGLVPRESVVVGKSGPGALGSASVEIDFPRDLPLKFLNNYGFDLGLEEHREMLEAEVEQLRPVFMVLDPLYLILGGADENSSAQLRPFLKWLLQLRYKYNVAIALIHHFRKQNMQHGVTRPGQRIMGSGTLHGWVDSALYLEARDSAREGWVNTRVEKEFRSMAPQKGMELGLAMSPPGGLTMEVELSTYSVENVIREMVRQEPGVTVNALAEALKMDKRTVLGRIRGGELGLRVEVGKAGRGHSHKVYEVSVSENGKGA
jgi:AAA domain